MFTSSLEVTATRMSASSAPATVEHLDAMQRLGWFDQAAAELTQAVAVLVDKGDVERLCQAFSQRTPDLSCPRIRIFITLEPYESAHNKNRQ